jgi:hypothetical protein
MMTFLGIIMTVLPIQFFEIIRLAIVLITSLVCCCLKSPVEKVSECFDKFTECVTALDKY